MLQTLKNYKDIPLHKYLTKERCHANKVLSVESFGQK